MFYIKVEPAFKSDYKRVVKKWPQVRAELKEAVAQLAQNGSLPAAYNPHLLVNSNANYTNHMEFHLAGGECDVLVLYVPHKTNPVIRLVRMGSHKELFDGRLV